MNYDSTGSSNNSDVVLCCALMPTDPEFYLVSNLFLFLSCIWIMNWWELQIDIDSIKTYFVAFPFSACYIFMRSLNLTRWRLLTSEIYWWFYFQFFKFSLKKVDITKWSIYQRMKKHRLGRVSKSDCRGTSITIKMYYLFLLKHVP